MNERIRTLWTQITTRWTGLAPNQRRNSIIAVVAAIVAAVAVFWVVLQPHYVTIMTGLDDKSLGQVQTQLETLKIPSEVNGDSVQVPEKDANEARIQLAMAGLPQSGYIGYSGVKSSLGMTSDEFNLQVLDALQQSLNATIQSVNGVESAQVHIVMPESQPFVVDNQQDTAKASVFVQLGAGVTLSSQQVAGIQNLVAHSVTGLSPSDVTVTDQNGVTLSGTSSDTNPDGAIGSDSEVALRSQLEQSLTEQLTQGLSQILGPGNAYVMVHANVSFDQVKTTSNQLVGQPGTGAGFPTSTQTQRTTSTSGSATAGGSSGQAGSNPGVPSYAGSSSNGNNSTSSNSQTTTNYDYSTNTTNTVKDPVQIAGYTVGVFLNSNDKTITPAVVNQVKTFVQSAVGETASQNQNNISVSPIPFSATANLGESVTKGLNQGELIAISAGTAALVVGLIAFFIYRRRKQENQPTTINTEMYTIEEDLQLEQLPLSDSERVQEQLARLAKDRPQEFASLLRTWLAE